MGLTQWSPRGCAGKAQDGIRMITSEMYDLHERWPCRSPSKRAIPASSLVILLDEDGRPSQRGQTIIGHTPAGRAVPPPPS